MAGISRGLKVSFVILFLSFFGHSESVTSFRRARAGEGLAIRLSRKIAREFFRREIA